MELSERVASIEAEVKHVSQRVDDISPKVDALVETTSVLVGKMETIENFLMSPQKSLMSSVSFNIWKITKTASILTILFIGAEYVLKHVDDFIKFIGGKI